ncbi:hypothetical protein B0I37DRAFT_391333 [Chaetomium sp. MPI-CAGE-AT-0009]|nr:hypothetical protein B0I37DRAFT_391333 [Chaetomium sp. MPI-CAGE-AT-0009]
MCSSCEVLFYCGTTHQAMDQPHHKSACLAIEKTRTQLHGKDKALRVGYLHPHEYTRMKIAAVDALLKVDTMAAVEKALVHVTDMLRLTKNHNLGATNIVPGLLLRLGREQECYDFLKRWTFVDDNHIRGANAFEPIDAFCSADLSLTHLAILTLLKVRLYLDLEQLERFERDSESEDELLDRPLGELVRARIRSDFDVSEMAALVGYQYRRLCRVVNNANPHFWDALFDGEIPPMPDSYSSGTVEEAHLAVHQCRAAWHESEGAIDMVNSETARFTLVYRAPRGLPGAGAGDPHWEGHGELKRAKGLIKSWATGGAFPSKAQATLPIRHPVDLFTPMPVGTRQTWRFVSRLDRATALVYTDGACANNGQTNPRGGWAVVLGPADGGNAPIVSGRLEETGPFGDRDCVATSNRAELRAAIAALRLSNWDKEGLPWVRNWWKTRKGGHVKNRDLWDLLLGEKIPRELNSDADEAAKAAANDKPAVMEFTDAVVSGTRVSVLLLCLEYESLFDAVHKRLVTCIAAKANMERATTVEAALDILARQDPPSIILVADGAITRHRKVCEAVIDSLWDGATVVLAGCFSSMVSMGQCNRFFARLGLPWEQGWYERTMVDLGRNTVHARLASRLPSTYSQKAVFMKKVAPSAAWYTSRKSSRQTAVAFTKVGVGRLGYVGDVNGEEASNTVVLAMCGLLG